MNIETKSNNTTDIKNDKVKKSLYKKWWFWLIIIILIFGTLNNNNTNTINEVSSPNTEISNSGSINKELEEEKIKLENINKQFE